MIRQLWLEDGLKYGVLSLKELAYGRLHLPDPSSLEILSHRAVDLWPGGARTPILKARRQTVFWWSWRHPAEVPVRYTHVRLQTTQVATFVSGRGSPQVPVWINFQTQIPQILDSSSCSTTSGKLSSTFVHSGYKLPSIVTHVSLNARRTHPAYKLSNAHALPSPLPADHEPYWTAITPTTRTSHHVFPVPVLAER